MTTNGKIVLGLVVLIIVVAGGWYAFAHKGTPAVAPVATTTDMQVTDTDTTNTGNPPPTEEGATTDTHKTVTVTYSDQGFSPNSVSIAIGDTVNFVNQSSHGMWVASDAHPTHTEYDGTSLSQHCTAGADTKGGFDECSPVNAGSTYSFTFPKAGTFEYHNHVRASDTGTVSVK